MKLRLVESLLSANSCTRDHGHLPTHVALRDRCSAYVLRCSASIFKFLQGVEWDDLRDLPLCPSLVSASMLDLREVWTVGSFTGSISILDLVF